MSLCTIYWVDLKNIKKMFFSFHSPFNFVEPENIMTIHLITPNTLTFNTFPFLYHCCRKINVHLFTMLKIISYRWKNLDVERAEQQMVSRNPFTIHRKKSIQIHEPQHYRPNIQHSSKSIGIACQINIRWTSNNTDL